MLEQIFSHTLSHIHWQHPDIFKPRNPVPLLKCVKSNYHAVHFCGPTFVGLDIFRTERQLRDPELHPGLGIVPIALGGHSDLGKNVSLIRLHSSNCDHELDRLNNVTLRRCKWQSFSHPAWHGCNNQITKASDQNPIYRFIESKEKFPDFRQARSKPHDEMPAARED